MCLEMGLKFNQYSERLSSHICEKNKQTNKKKNSGEVRELFKQKGDSFEVENVLVWCEILPLSVDDKIIAYSRGKFLENFL